jgi:hypothetical protein
MNEDKSKKITYQEKKEMEFSNINVNANLKLFLSTIFNYFPILSNVI